MQYRITVVLEDIIRQRVDAIVNAANSALLGDALGFARIAEQVRALPPGRGVL
jgi:O-acetyl-ADP-ribose deacetylase (regulator of RNase III)